MIILQIFILKSLFCSYYALLVIEITESLNVFHEAPLPVTTLILTLLQHNINHLDEGSSCTTDLLRKQPPSSICSTYIFAANSEDCALELHDSRLQPDN